MPLHQDVCDTYNINRYELAEKLGVSKSTLDSWSDESRMSKVTRLALELMLDNYVKTKLLSDFGDNIAKISKFCNSSFNTLVENDDQKKIVSRIRYIIGEYGLNTITASKKLNLPDFEYLDKVLKTQIYPSFDFLEKFSESFFISNDWLNTGKGHPFSLELANSYYLSHLSEKIKDFKQIYIVHSKDNKAYTKVIVEDRLERFDIFRTDFCIGEDYWMENSESNSLFELYNFYIENKYIISLVALERDEYDKLISRDYYAKPILEKSSHSYMLDDLFDLQLFNQEKYGEFFIECTNIIKSIKENKKGK